MVACARLSRSCGVGGVLRAVSPGVGYGFTPRFRGVWLGFLSPPGAPRRGAQPRGAHPMLGEVPALRLAARTGEKGAAAGEPAGGPRGGLLSLRRPFFSPFLAFHALESGADREKRCCGPLRASDGGARAVAGPEMSPPRHPPSAGPDRSRPLQPLGERVNRTCGPSCSVRRRPLCDRREAAPIWRSCPAEPPLFGPNPLFGPQTRVQAFCRLDGGRGCTARL